MTKESSLLLGKIDRLIKKLEEESQTTTQGMLSTIESLCADVDQELERRKREVAEWSVEQKREFAVNGDDPYVLSLLSMDESFNVRTLVFCNPNVPENLMRRALEKASDYVLMVIANNPNSPSDVLDRIVELTREPEVLNAVKLNPNVSEVTKYKIENRKT